MLSAATIKIKRLQVILNKKVEFKNDDTTHALPR